MGDNVELHVVLRRIGNDLINVAAAVEKEKDDRMKSYELLLTQIEKQNNEIKELRGEFIN